MNFPSIPVTVWRKSVEKNMIRIFFLFWRNSIFILQFCRGGKSLFGFFYIQLSTTIFTKYWISMYTHILFQIHFAFIPMLKSRGFITIFFLFFLKGNFLSKKKNLFFFFCLLLINYSILVVNISYMVRF